MEFDHSTAPKSSKPAPADHGDDVKPKIVRDPEAGRLIKHWTEGGQIHGLLSFMKARTRARMDWPDTGRAKEMLNVRFRVHEIVDENTCNVIFDSPENDIKSTYNYTFDK
jgi:hypothetical protein